MSQFPPPSSFPDDLDDQFAAPPVWPKVIGIISIVLGALGLTCAGCGVIGMAFFLPMAEQQLGEPLPPPMRPGALQIALMGVGLLMSFLLIIAGSVTVARRFEGRALHLAYAVLNIPLVLASTALQIKQMNDMAQWAANNPDSPWAANQNAPGSNIGQMAGLGIGILIGLAYPVFLLIWFAFVKPRREDMIGTAPPPAA